MKNWWCRQAPSFFTRCFVQG